MKKNPLVSIIVVTFNSEKYIHKCLDSIFKLKYQNTEIILVDCNSTDKTADIIREYGSKLNLIRLSENVGFAKANNLAFSKAKGDFIFLANPDTVLDSGALEPLIQSMNIQLDLAAAQPSVFLLQDRSRLNLTGKVVHYLGFDWVRDYRTTESPLAGKLTSISGAAVLLRTQVIKKIGLFDETYFMYYEDSDLAWRIRLSGFSMAYVPESIVYHDYKYLLDNPKATRRKYYYCERNRVITMLKNYQAKTLLMISPMIIASELGMILLSLIQGWFVVKLKAEWGAVKSIRHILVERKRIKAMRRTSDRELLLGFESRLTFSYFDHPLVRLIANPIFRAYWSGIKLII